MKVYCGECEHYNPTTWLYTTGQKNVSGNLAWYRAWGENCAIRKSAKYKDYECSFYEEQKTTEQKKET